MKSIQELFHMLSLPNVDEIAFMQAFNEKKDIVNQRSDITYIPLVTNITMLMLAAYKGHSCLVDFLLKNDADITCLDNEQNTVLHHAAFSNNANIIQSILNADKSHNSILNASNERNETAFYIATKLDCTKSVNSLIERSVNINIPNKENLNCLHQALLATTFKTELFQTLINMRADLNLQSNHLKQTPLHLAIDKQNMTATKILLESGAALDLKDMSNRTPIELAVHMNYIQFFDMLISAHLKGGDINILEQLANQNILFRNQYATFKEVAIFMSMEKETVSKQIPIELKAIIAKQAALGTPPSSQILGFGSIIQDHAKRLLSTPANTSGKRERDEKDEKDETTSEPQAKKMKIS